MATHCDSPSFGGVVSQQVEYLAAEVRRLTAKVAELEALLEGRRIVPVEPGRGRAAEGGKKSPGTAEARH